MRRFTTIGRLAATTLSTALVALALPALAGEATDKVQEMNAAWDAAFNAGDAAAVAEMYAEDAKVVTGDGTVKTGRDEIEALFQSFMDSGFGEHKLSTDTVRAGEDMVYGAGDWEGVGGDGKTYGGKVVNIYERQDDGTWKTVLHMWN